MDVLANLASSLGRRDEVPNQELARAIVASDDKQAVDTLVSLVDDKDKNIQSDAIKVLYEIGEQAPALIAHQAGVFLRMLGHKNNRLVWGAMTALDAIAGINHKEVFPQLAQILSVADTGSVITRDHAVGILIKLSAHQPYYETCFPLLLEQLSTCPNNQLAMYAERSLPLIGPDNKTAFIEILHARIDGLEKASQQQRIEKVIKKASKT